MSDANKTIRKPYESSNGDRTKSIVSVIRDVVEKKKNIRYKAGFVVATTFGVDLSKWREILHVLFEDFNELKKFEKAILFTDCVSIKDSDGKDVIGTDNLTIYTGGTSSSYLHAKIILVRFDMAESDMEEQEHQYVLFVSSKNITYSQSVDMVTYLDSTEGEVKDPTDGSEVYDFINFLIEEKENADRVRNEINDLKKYNFKTVDSDGEFPSQLTKIEFSYDDNHRFTDDIWKDIYKSDLCISPYISKDEYDKWKDKWEGNEKRIISYYETYEKLISDGEQMGNVVQFVGKINDLKRYKFHVKMYCGMKGTNTYIVLGSANLTSEGKKNHYEMLVEIEYQDDGIIHGYIKGQVLNENNNWIEKYEHKDNVIKEEMEQDDEIGVIGRTYNYSLYKLENDDRYEWKVYNDGSLKEDHIYINKKDISQWIVGDEWTAFVCADNYRECDDENCLRLSAYLDLVKENINKQRSRYYNDLFKNVARKTKNRGNKKRGNNENTATYTKYPCLYRCLIEKKNNEGDAKCDEKAFVFRELKRYYETQIDENDQNNDVVKYMKEYIDAIKEIEKKEERTNEQ